ncbi:unnamed protein product [Caenorhabditis auriculariae]|uniref:Tetratricopeptide repeat protein 17 n=1 Tax=Caenorhabditis auriculariae TaxID=2777116 RepID=A0A8S1HHL4_9PELO|nr:unnamed protein product [Caenorhabditis auriculariae]
MHRVKLLAWAYLFLIMANDVVLATYHWRISDDEKKIEAVFDTPYALAVPGALVDFVRQMENVRDYGESYTQLQQAMRKISSREKMDDPNFEATFRISEQSCLNSHGIPLEPQSFHTSYSAELCPEFHETYRGYTTFLKEYFDTPPDNEKRPPRCQYWFDAMRMKGAYHIDFSVLKIKPQNESPDPAYAHILQRFFPQFLKFDPKDPKPFAVALASMLSHHDERVSNNPYLHMAAAAYWRSLGRLSEALDCYRSGVHFIHKPRRVEHSRFFSEFGKEAITLATGTLLTRVGFADVAQVIFEYFRDEKASPKCYRAMALGAAGDASVLTGPEDGSRKGFRDEAALSKLSEEERSSMFAPALQDYAKALQLIQQLQARGKDGEALQAAKEATTEKSALLSCHIKLTYALEHQKENLDKLVQEKNRFNEVYTKQKDVEVRMLKLAASHGLHRVQKMFYESIKYGYNPRRICKMAYINRFPQTKRRENLATFVVCEATSEKAYEESMVEQRKQTLVGRPPQNESSWRVADVFPRNKVYEKKLEALRAQTLKVPQMPRKYPKELEKDRERPWRRVDWPNSVDCQAVVSRSDPFRLETFPQVFISPEHRGYIVSEFVTKFIGLEANEELPLPWFEPRCDSVEDVTLEAFKRFESLNRVYDKEMDRSDPTVAEKSLKTVLVRLADRIIDEYEMGGRIWTLINYKIGPQWVAYNLAGLYWRVQGNAYQAIRCLSQAVRESPTESYIALVQMSQVFLRATRSVADSHEFLQKQFSPFPYRDPLFYYVQGRMKLLMHDVDKAIQHLKDAMDKNPDDEVIAEDLLKVACSGMSTKPAISSKYPTVCCSPLVQNAVCIRPRENAPEQCYVIETDAKLVQHGRLVYHRCNGVYTGVSKKTSDYANIVSPFLPVFNTVSRKDDLSYWIDDADSIQTVESKELPLDYGGTQSFFAQRPAEWWMNAKSEMRYEVQHVESDVDEWEEEVDSDLAVVPPKPLSFLWIREKTLMLNYDAKAPSHLPSPSTHQIRRGVAVFPPPRVNTNSCNGVSKLEVLFDNAPSTWVSVTAKGEDIEKYVDLRGPIPGIASLQPVCPFIDKYENSPILGLDHIPAFALSDQFLFYKPEKALTDALKSLGNERDSIEHVAARLHTALLASGAGSNGKRVNWLLCVLSSLYWRVSGDAENAMNCLRCALHSAPPQMRDVALVSLANICHQAGLLNSALIAAGAALTTSPTLVAIHFTLANIYASIGDYQRALEFYYSTLSLQSNFLPAKERIRAIYCNSGQKFDFQTA